MDKVSVKSTELLEAEMPATQMMTKEFKSLRPHDSLLSAVAIYKEKKLDTIPVVDEDNVLIGVLPRGRLYQALLEGKSLNNPCGPYIVKSPRVLQATYNYDELTFAATVTRSNEGTLPVIDKSGTVVGMIGRLEYLRASLIIASRNASLLESIFQSMHEGIITVNNEGYIMRINSSAEGMFGINGSQATGKHLHTFFPNLAFNNQRRLGMRNTLGGVPVIVNQVPLIEKDKFIGVNLVFLDLSDEENISQELESVKELGTTLSGVLTASSDGVLVSDKGGIVKYANETAAQLFACKLEQMIGKPIEVYLGTEFPSSVVDNGLAKVELLTVKGRECIVSHVPAIDKDKDTHKTIGIVSTLYWDDNKVTGEIAKKWFTLQHQVEYYRKELEKTHFPDNNKFNRIVSKNEMFNKFKREAMGISRSNSTVLLTGESGVGKDMFARAIHAASSRLEKPFVKVNCAAIPETLFESELFGYAPGSFTGASKKGRKGYFEQADKGTIFLDEIGDMPLSIQVKILQVLQDREFMRVGGTSSEKVDVRIIAATNRNLREAMSNGEFREDLYYRLNVIEFHLPPLRARKEDVLLLAKIFIEKYNTILGTKVTGITPEAQEAMKIYTWPGNIRELENAIERAANYVWEGEIRVDHLPQQVTTGLAADPNNIKEYESALHDVNKRMILDALNTTNGNKSAAARLLNISRTAFYEKLNKYVLDDRQTY